MFGCVWFDYGLRLETVKGGENDCRLEKAHRTVRSDEAERKEVCGCVCGDIAVKSGRLLRKRRGKGKK